VSSPAAALPYAFWRALKLVMPSGRSIATSPSRIAVGTVSASTARATDGKRSVQSFAFRLHSRAFPFSTRARMR
jgi:hypothetical protein